jgi:hypothetical protein
MSQSTIWTAGPNGEDSLKILQTFERAQQLSHLYWELLVELAILWSWPLQNKFTCSPQIVKFLVEAQEWSKLECWIATVWMVWPPEADGTAEEDLGHLMLLSRQRPGAIQKLEQWMERWSRRPSGPIPELFQRICKQAQEAAQRDAP